VANQSSRKWPCSTLAFTADCRRLPPCIPVLFQWLAQGIRRYGFHGINHQYCAERAAQILGRELSSLKLVTCHLGNGCSLAAILHGRSVDTTMGFTPLDRLIMGTRSGSLDPGILTYLMREENSTGEQLDNLLNTNSGCSEFQASPATCGRLLPPCEQETSEPGSHFEMFVHHLQSAIGAMIAVLGGIDAIFTAGIGENSPEVRGAACANFFEVLGLKLDGAKNAQSPAEQKISFSDSALRALIIRAQEDWAIACDCWRPASVSRGHARTN
jgi:acetate kinase